MEAVGRRGPSATPRPTGREVKAEADAVNAAFVRALRVGGAGDERGGDGRRRAAPRGTSTSASTTSTTTFHRGLADMYVADPRFTKTYEDIAPGLAAYVRDAIHANADRHATAG